MSRAGSRSQSEASTESLADALTALCAEVGIPFEEMLATVEGALAAAYKRAFSPAGDVTVKLGSRESVQFHAGERDLERLKASARRILPKASPRNVRR